MNLWTQIMPGWFGEHSIAPRGPRVTPTASATLLMPIWRRARDRLSNTMSFASADVTCGGNGGGGRWGLGRPRRAASQLCHPPLAAREKRTRCVNRNEKAQRSSCNGMRRLRCHGTLCWQAVKEVASEGARGASGKYELGDPDSGRSATAISPRAMLYSFASAAPTAAAEGCSW